MKTPVIVHIYLSNQRVTFLDKALWSTAEAKDYRSMILNKKTIQPVAMKAIGYGVSYFILLKTQNHYFVDKCRHLHDLGRV